MAITVSAVLDVITLKHGPIFCITDKMHIRTSAEDLGLSLLCNSFNIIFFFSGLIALDTKALLLSYQSEMTENTIFVSSRSDHVKMRPRRS